MAPLKPPSLPPLAKYIAGKRASEAAKAKKAHVRVNAPPPADVEGGPLSETDWARAGINRGDGESKATTVKGMWGLERQLDAIPDASAEKLVAVLPDRSLGIEIYASAPVALLYQIVTLITLPLFVLYLLLKAIMGTFLWMANGVVYYCCCGRPSFAEVKPGDGWCLITGASYGIGNSIAREMASRGYDVILVARTTSKLTECAEQCRAFGVQAKVVTQDLALENSPEQLWKKVQEMGLDVSILVNNAGAGFYGIFNEVNWGKYSYMINLNMRTYAGNIHHFGRPMIEKGRGHILNIASIASFAPAPSEASTTRARLSFSRSARPSSTSCATPACRSPRAAPASPRRASGHTTARSRRRAPPRACCRARTAARVSWWTRCSSPQSGPSRGRPSAGS
mmetsp:Transcript_10954/g.35102  ORF Transcript_10954/g.35102 Transcript_10954/m.35102 type:complete len:396 (-) Transcript_10954:454-1641(-)